MTASLPTEDTAPGLGRTWCVVFQHGTNSPARIRLLPDKVTNILLGEYTVSLRTVPHHITRPVSEVAAPEVSTTSHTRASSH